MSTNWNDAAKKIKAFKTYMKGAPKSVPEKKGYLLTREMIEELLEQNECKLDGIRLYFGADMIEDFMVPTLVIVGCEKDGDGKYNDFGVPEKNLKTLAVNTFAAVAANGSSKVGKGLPCPTECSKPNMLNS